MRLCKEQFDNWHPILTLYRSSSYDPCVKLDLVLDFKTNSLSYQVICGAHDRKFEFKPFRSVRLADSISKANDALEYLNIPDQLQENYPGFRGFEHVELTRYGDDSYYVRLLARIEFWKTPRKFHYIVEGPAQGRVSNCKHLDSAIDAFNKSAEKVDNHREHLSEVV